MDFIYVLGIIFVVFLFSFALINLRQIFTGNDFRGTCASNNPALKNELGDCSVCGNKPGGEKCKNPDKAK